MVNIPNHATPQGNSPRMFNGPLRGVGAWAAAVALALGIGAGMAHDQKTRAAHDQSISWRLENNLHRPSFDDTLEAIDSPWYDVKNASFRTTVEGVRVRWNPAYADLSQTTDRLSNADYYGQLAEIQEFDGIDEVVLAGSYDEDVYDDSGAWIGTTKMPYLGIPYEKFASNLADDDPLKEWLQKCGLDKDSMIFIALGKTDIEVSAYPNDTPNFQRAETFGR
jgi:hypothetical protein